MKKFKIFISNIFVYGFGGVISRIVPIVMLPIVTRLMPDSGYYGLNDLSMTLVSVGQAIAVFGMYDAMFRLFFDKDDEIYQKQICSTAFLITMITSLAVFFVIIGFNQVLSKLIFKDEQYSYLVCLAAFAILVGATNNIVAAPTKIQNKSKTFIIVNTLSPIIAYSMAIPLLLSGYYSFALQISNLVAAILIEGFFIYKNRGWFSFKYVNWLYIKPLLKIAVPLMPSFLIYWIYHSADRLMIQHFLNAQEVGIYAIGSKLGQISNLIYTAFTGGWLYFAYSTMKEEAQVKNNSRIFEYLGIIAYSASVLACAFSYNIYKIVFTEEYLPGYKVAPYLFFAPLLQMLFQVAGNQFIVMKKVLPNVLILFAGAIVNVGLNLILIPRVGIEGAAIGTIMGYLFADIICVIVLLKIEMLVLSKRFVIATAGILLFWFIWVVYLYRFIFMGICTAVVIILLYCYLYRRDIVECFRLFKVMVFKRKE